jgi:hypothetical protein
VNSATDWEPYNAVRTEAIEITEEGEEEEVCGGGGGGGGVREALKHPRTGMQPSLYVGTTTEGYSIEFVVQDYGGGGGEIDSRRGSGNSQRQVRGRLHSRFLRPFLRPRWRHCPTASFAFLARSRT